MKDKFLVLPLVLLNFWIWQIFKENLLIFGLLIITTLVLFFYFLKPDKRLLLLLFPMILALSYLQITHTKVANLFLSDTTQIHIQNQRVTNYPVSDIQIGEKVFHYPIGNLLDGRKETLAIYRFSENIFQSLDLNYYFFASHPRERVGINEFEKYPFIYLVFLIIGLLTIDFRKLKSLFLITLGIPLVLIGVIGINSKIGIFIIYPVITAIIMLGIYQTLLRIKK